MKFFILPSAIILFAMLSLTANSQTGGMNTGNLQANESIQVGTASESVVIHSDLISLPPLTDSEILLIPHPAEGSMVYATDSDVLLVFNGWNWKRADGNNDQYLDPRIPCPGMPNVTDFDGNTYNTILIGTQCWMKENLKVTRYPNGDTIPYITNNSTWAALEDKNTDDDAYCYYNNNTSSDYGALYTYAAAIADNWQRDNASGQGICPDGWHLPTGAEWTEMEDYLIANGYNWDGSTSDNKVAKSLASTTGWHLNSEEGTVGNDQISNNKTGFTGLPGGRRLSGDGTFLSGDFDGFWWSATESSNNEAEAKELYLSYNNVNVLIGFNSKSSGFSVRCLRD